MWYITFYYFDLIKHWDIADPPCARGHFLVSANIEFHIRFPYCKMIYIKPKLWLRFLHKVSTLDVLKNCFCLLEDKFRLLKQYILQIFYFYFHPVRKIMCSHISVIIWNSGKCEPWWLFLRFCSDWGRYSCFTNHRQKLS